MNNLNNIPGEIIKTSQLPEDMPTHLVGVILGTSPKTVKYSTTLFASQIASQMTNVVSTSFVYSDPTWIGSLNWNKIINTPSTILGYGITDAVSSSRTLSINGTTYDLSANRSWTVGDVLSSGSYSDPSWITSLAWTKISGAPAFLTAESDTLASVTGRGNSTTNAITVGGITTNGSFTASGGTAIANYISPTLVATANNDILYALQINPTFNNSGGYSNIRSNHINLISNGRINGTNQINLLLNNIGIVVGLTTSTAISSYISSVPLLLQVGQATFGQFSPTTGNFILQNGGSFTDAGYRLDVTGTTRLNGLQTFQGTTASDTAPLGSELLTTGTGTNWTGTGFTTGYTHTVGSTATLTSTLAAVVGNFYQITYTITGRTAGSIQLDFGGSSFYNITATGAVGPKATTTGTVVITPTTDFNGVLVLSIKVISGASATTTWTTSSGTQSVEMRVSNIVSNLFIGGSSGRYNTTGFNNVFFGTNAGAVNTTGSQNIAIGTNTLTSNTIGISNFALGTAALGANVTGNQNVAIGTSTLQNIAAGSNNLAFGYTALFPLTSGNDNIAIGATAGRYISGGVTNATAISQSILIGSGTKPLADSQSNQIIIGNNTTGLGSNTTIIGNSSTVTTALYGNLLLGTTTATGAGLTVSNAITASSAIARGVYFNQTLTAAANNDVLVGLDIQPTFTNGSFTGVTNYALRVTGVVYSSSFYYGVGIVGNTTLALSSSGSNNMSFYTNSTGIERMRLFGSTGNITIQNGGTFTDAGFRLDVVGADSRFNGIRAGLGAGQVASNTVFGNGALGSNVSATGVTAIGFEALRVSTANNNTALGYYALRTNTTGDSNVAIGKESLRLNSTGAENTAIGTVALFNNSSGNLNVAIGSSCLIANTTGSNNTAIGVGCVSGNFSGSVILGRGATATASNQFVIGSTSYNAGAVATETNTTISSWAVKINGTDRKLLLLDTAQNVIDVKQSVAASTSTTTIDWASGNVSDTTLTSNTTFTLSNPVIGTYIIKLTQGGAGGFLATWPVTIKWSGGIAPVLTTTAGKIDIITLVWDGTAYFGSYALNF